MNSPLVKTEKLPTSTSNLTSANNQALCRVESPTKAVVATQKTVVTPPANPASVKTEVKLEEVDNSMEVCNEVEVGTTESEPTIKEEQVDVSSVKEEQIDVITVTTTTTSTTQQTTTVVGGAIKSTLASQSVIKTISTSTTE